LITQSQYLSSGRMGSVWHVRDRSIQSQITIHKINIECVHHLYWCMPDNGWEIE